MTRPAVIENAPSIYGPKLSELTPFTREVSAAIAELKLPTEFSRKSNHPIFFVKIES